MDAGACVDIFGLCLSRKVDLSLFLTLGLFFAGVRVNSRIGRAERREDGERAEMQRRAARKSFIKALGEEINLNVASLDKAAGGFPSNSKINKFMARGKKHRPFLTFSYFSVIYTARTEILQDLPDILIRNIVEFYGRLNDLAVDVASVDKDSFLRISRQGREEVIYDIVCQLKVAVQQGRSISDSIELQLSPERMF